MFIVRNGFYAEAAASVVKLKEACVGCKDCKGACLDLLQLAHLPDVLLELREARA